jgi:hypothetical protein
MTSSVLGNVFLGTDSCYIIFSPLTRTAYIFSATLKKGGTLQIIYNYIGGLHYRS